MATETIPETKAECIVLAEDVQIPLGIRNLADFREWVHSNDFPERGRIDFLVQNIEVDMSPEDLFMHGTPKVEICARIYEHVQSRDLGHVFVDQTRISSPVAEFSVEPDVVFLSHETIDSKIATFVPKASGAEGRLVEIEGAVDLVVEIVSDSSVGKDTNRLPPLYFAAGMQELWLVDVRGEELIFHIHHRGENAFQAAETDAEGFQLSEVLQRRYRLSRSRSPRGHFIYELQSAQT